MKAAVGGMHGLAWLEEAPVIIYLQMEYDGEPTDEITWCVDHVEESDVQYTRSDIVDKLATACKALVAAMVDYELDVNDEFTHPPYKHQLMMKQARDALALVEPPNK